MSLVAPAEGDDPAPLRLELGPEAALVALDVRTGEVLALVGSHEALPGGLDRATQSRRQPGSAWKPIVFAAALQARRITPATVLDVPAARPRPGDPATQRIQVRDGFARSDNDLAVAVLRDVGAPRVVELARALGVESKLGATDSLALGAYEVTPLELAAATATFARGGEVIAPRLVTALRRSAGGDLALPALPPPRRALEPDEAYLVTSLLRSVVTSGTARLARTLGHPVAGKTGTTNDARDAWFVGYSTEIVAAVWVGYDDNLPLGRSESGGVTALPAFMEFLRAASAGRPGTEFVRPPSIVTARVDRESGLLARDGRPSDEEEFLEGTVPEALAPEPDAGAVAPGGADAGRAMPPGLADSPSPGSALDAGERPDELPPF
ncbi:MAG: hypothetical protein FJ104_03545 [Deltaproteobacteria bacterium]|nr:hypothetical protein [Deltaproteobacteria bacterium]